MQPFVKIEGDRVGALDAAQLRPQALREIRGCAERAVDVKPQTFALREIGQLVERIDCADVDRARISHDEKRAQSRGAIARDRLRNGVRLRAMVVIHGQHAQIRRAQARIFKRFAYASVRRSGRVADELRGVLVESAFAHVVPECARARDQHRRKVCGRRADDEQSACALRPAEEIAKPCDDLPFDVNRTVIAPADVRIHHRRKHVGQRAGRRSRCRAPSPKNADGCCRSRTA